MPPLPARPKNHIRVFELKERNRMTTESSIKLPLYARQEALGARFIQFSQWEVPVYFSSILEEHQCVRTNVGVFDVSHMGELRIKGAQAKEFLNNLLPNKIWKLEPGKAVYSPMLNEEGGIIDDLIVSELEEDNYLVIVNAANIEKDVTWMESHLPEGVELSNISSDRGILAVQGPRSPEFIEQFLGSEFTSLKRFNFKTIQFEGSEVVLSRTGYTGEDGFEFFFDKEISVSLYDAILKTGESFDLKPIGFGARDTLRLESCLLLHGHDMNDTISPLEAGLKWTIDFEKENFIGKQALLEQKENGLERKLVGFEMLDRGLAREEYRVQKDGKDIGWVTSGTHSPTLKKSVGLALIQSEFSGLDTEIDIVVREQPCKAKVIKIPFYKTV